MLSKLMKYDMRSTKRFGIPILLALLGVTVLGIINAFFMMSLAEKLADDSIIASISFTASVFMTIFLFMLIGVAATAIEVVILIDFYRTLVSDVGYLTFTLPVKPRTILVSKLINSSVWTVIIAVACFIAMAAIIFTMVATGMSDEILPDEPIEPMPPMGADAVLMIILGILFVIAYFFNSQLLCFMAIFFASVITRKNKVLAAVGCVLGVNFIYGIASSVFQSITFLIAGVISSETESMLGMNLYLGISAVLLTALSVLFFFVTEYMMRKKVNLA